MNVPGLINDCSVSRATLRSTLECYYNRTCLSLLHDDLANYVEPLSADKNQYFSINATIKSLLNSLMIDNYNLDASLDLHYAQCNPSYCYYMYTRRFQPLFIITIIIGIYGALSTILRSLVPWIAKTIINRQNQRPHRE
ncbi:unnamed protein product, partial [Rotaria sp. Silwood2]